MELQVPRPSKLRTTLGGCLVLSTLGAALPAYGQDPEQATVTQAETQRTFSSFGELTGNTSMARIVAQTGTVQCPIHLLQSAYDEATSGYQAAVRYVTAIEVMHLCREHDDLFREVMDAEAALVQSYADLRAAREQVEGAAPAVPPAAAARSTNVTGVRDLLDLFRGNDDSPEAADTKEFSADADTAELVEAEKVFEESVPVPTCVEPRPASAYVLIGSTNSAGGEPRGILGLVDSHNPNGDYYEESVSVGVGDFLVHAVEVTEVNVPWSDESGEPFVVLSDCAGSVRLTMVSQMPSGHFVNPSITYRNSQTGAAREVDATLVTPRGGE